MQFLGYQTVVNLDKCEFFKLNFREQDTTFVEIKFVYGEGKSIDAESNDSPIRRIIRFFHSSKIYDFIRHGGLPREFANDLQLIHNNCSLDIPFFMCGDGVVSIRQAISNSSKYIALSNCRRDDERVCMALLKYINRNETFITNENLLKWFFDKGQVFAAFHHAVIENKNGYPTLITLKRLKLEEVSNE